MASVQAERSTAAEDHAAAVADRAATEAALATREAKIIEDSEPSGDPWTSIASALRLARGPWAPVRPSSPITRSGWPRLSWT